MRWYWTLLLVFLALFLLAAFLMGRKLFQMTLCRRKSGKLKAKGSVSFKAITTVEEEDAAWFRENGEERELTARDGTRLFATRVIHPEGGDRWVLVIHGFRGNRWEMAGAARKFYEMGFHVLTPDLRAHGKSEGDYIGMGWPEHFDMVEWIAALREENPAARVALFGISMGAATAMMTAGENPEGAAALIEDCGYSSVREEFTYQLKELFHLPPFPLLPAASLISRIKAGYFFGTVSPKRAVMAQKLPALFIHGTADAFIPCRMAEELYATAGEPRQLELFEGARHVESAAREPERYWRVVEEFLCKYMP